MIPVDFETTLKTRKLSRYNHHTYTTVVMYGIIAVTGFALILLATIIPVTFYRYAYIFIVLPAAVIVAGYFVYAKYTELNMMLIPSPFPKETNKEIIATFLQKDEFDTEYLEGDNLIATKAIDITLTRQMQLTIIFIEGGILVNVIGNFTNLAGAVADQWDDYGFLLMSSSGVRENIEWEIKKWGKTKDQYIDEWVKEL